MKGWESFMIFVDYGMVVGDVLGIILRFIELMRLMCGLEVMRWVSGLRNGWMMRVLLFICKMWWLGKFCWR